jgi:hypothetical protein
MRGPNPKLAETKWCGMDESSMWSDGFEVGNQITNKLSEAGRSDATEEAKAGREGR